MKRNTIIRFVARIVGVVILIVGIRMIAEGTINYIDQHQQKDWVVINAEVTDISSRLRNTKSQHKQRSTVYDITYEYEVDGEVYSDEIRSQPTPRLVGDDIRIKYNPDAPEESTTSLSPSISDLLVFVIFGLIFSTLGFFLSGMWVLIRKIRRKGQPEEEEVLPPEEYVKPEEVKRSSRNSGKSILLRIALAIAVVGVIILSTKLFPGTQAVDAEQFIEVVEAEGYTTSDTTDELSQSWKVGSMLKEAVSFNDGNIRMDYCVMDTADSASVLYDGMTLPLSEGEKQEYDGIVHELYSIESDALYVAKIRIRDTVICVSAKIEYKSEVVELLETLGYWKD